MKLSKIKADKSDSKMICKYAEKVDLRLWEGESKQQQKERIPSIQIAMPRLSNTEYLFKKEPRKTHNYYLLQRGV